MAEGIEISPADLAELIERMDEAAASYIRGDFRHYRGSLSVIRPTG
jgi:hypothetical protein